MCHNNSRERVKYIRGIEGKGKDIANLLESIGANKSDPMAYDLISLREPQVLFYVDENKLIGYTSEKSTFGKLLLEYGEEIFIEPEYKFHVGDKVLWGENLFEIVKRHAKKGEPYYNVKQEKTGYLWDNIPEQSFKEQEPQVKSWYDLLGKPIKGYYLLANYIYFQENHICTENDINLASSEKTARSMLAIAQISQLLPYYDIPFTDDEWTDESIKKFVFIRIKNSIRITYTRTDYNILAFRTKIKAEEFYKSNPKLVHDYFELPLGQQIQHL